MSAPSFFADGTPLVEGALVPLTTEEAMHVRVRRLPDGAVIVLLDGRGTAADAVLEPGGLAARVGRVRPGAGEPDRAVTVLLAAAEPARVEWAIEKGTECGAASFVLFDAERAQRAHVARLGARLDRLARVAREAVKQCGRCRVPEISGPVPLEIALAKAPAPLLAAAPFATRSVADGLAGARTASLLIGPEGGLAPYEHDILAARGAVPVSLGPRILRLETAVVAGLVLILDAPGAASP